MAHSIMESSGSLVVKFCIQHSGGRQDFGQPTVLHVAAHPAVELIGNAHHQRQQNQMCQCPQPDIGDGQMPNTTLDTRMDTKITTNRKLVPHRGWVPGLNADILHRQG